MKANHLACALAAVLLGGAAASAPALAGESVGERIDDAALVAKIKTNLLRSSDVKGLDVNVDAKDGVVTLSGSADTTAERNSAERIAREADGVTRVENRIVIRSERSAEERPTTPPPAVPPAMPPAPGLPPAAIPPPMAPPPADR